MHDLFLERLAAVDATRRVHLELRNQRQEIFLGTVNTFGSKGVVVEPRLDILERKPGEAEEPDGRLAVNPNGAA